MQPLRERSQVPALFPFDARVLRVAEQQPHLRLDPDLAAIVTATGVAVAPLEAPDQRDRQALVQALVAEGDRRALHAAERIAQQRVVVPGGGPADRAQEGMRDELDRRIERLFARQVQRLQPDVLIVLAQFDALVGDLRLADGGQFGLDQKLAPVAPVADREQRRAHDLVRHAALPVLPARQRRGFRDRSALLQRVDALNRIDHGGYLFIDFYGCRDSNLAKRNFPVPERAGSSKRGFRDACRSGGFRRAPRASG